MELSSLRDNAFEAPTSSSSGAIDGGIHSSAAPAASSPAGAAPASGFFATPFAAVGVEYGKTLLKSRAAEQLSAGLGGWLRQTRLRGYFQVSQLIVMRKVRKMLFPYVHRDWARQSLGESDSGLLAAGVAEGSSPAASFASAKEDVNAPDLYVGLMAFCTFVVCMGFALGSIGQFSPETLGLTATRSFVCLIFEVACVYGAFYLADAPHSAPLLDLLCLVLGQFVALNIDVVVGVIAGPTLFYITFFGLALSTAVYMMRSLQGWQPAGGDALAHSPVSPRYRSMLGVTAVLQLAFSFFLLWPALAAVHSSRGLSFSGLVSLEKAETTAGGLLSGGDSLPAPVLTQPTSAPTDSERAEPQARVDDIPSVLPGSVPPAHAAAADGSPADDGATDLARPAAPAEPAEKPVAAKPRAPRNSEPAPAAPTDVAQPKPTNPRRSSKLPKSPRAAAA